LVKKVSDVWLNGHYYKNGRISYAFRCMRHRWCTAGILYEERSLLLS